MKLIIDDKIYLTHLSEHHAEQLLELIDNNRVHLSKWFTWVNNYNNIQQIETLIANCKRQYQLEYGMTFGIFLIQYWRA